MEHGPLDEPVRANSTGTTPAPQDDPASNEVAAKGDVAHPDVANPDADADADADATDAGVLNARADEPDAASPTGSPPEADSRPRCPWCSTPYEPGSETCPSCGAALVARLGSDERQIIGVNEVDPELIDLDIRSRRPRKKGLLAELFPDAADELPAATYTPETDPAAILPPDEAVRSEMARIKAELELAKAQADARAAADASMLQAAEAEAVAAEAGAVAAEAGAVAAEAGAVAAGGHETSNNRPTAESEPAPDHPESDAFHNDPEATPAEPGAR